MRIEELKNYGKGYADWTDAENKQVEKAFSQGVKRQLGIIGSIKLIWKVRGETGQMKHHDWSMLREWGLTDQKLLNGSIEVVALAKALFDMVGTERATGMLKEMMEKEVYKARASMQPTASDFKQFEDPFAALRQYFKAYAAAESSAGIAKVVITEESDNVMSSKCDRCAMLEIAKAFGNPYLIYPGVCYGDEVLDARLAAALGFKFSSASMATGAPECIVRIERTFSPGGTKGLKA